MRVIYEHHGLNRCPNCAAPISATSVDKCPACDAAIADSNAPRPVDSPPHGDTSSIWPYIVGGPLILVSVILLLFAAKLGRNGGELAAVPALLYLVTGIAVINATSPTGKTLSLLASIFLYYVLYVLSSACIFCK